ncbi:MAG TPA: peptidylprolyl isomerase [Nostocaceae cyanobacterium]|nr:peptidylprolyl isomerase [Nostocaceae cyanobacterium]
MLQSITITPEDILQQIKLSCQIPTIIEQIINRKVIMAAAEELGIQVDTEELQKAADQTRLASKLHSSDDTWAWLEKHGLSLDDFEEIVYNGVLFVKLSQKLFTDKVEPFFYEHQLEYVGVVMYEVLLDDEDLALELYYAIQEGEMNYFEVAQKYIQDIELQRTFGYKGILKRKDLKPEISAAVFSAKPPQLLKPIVTSKGVSLIFVKEMIQPQLDHQLRYQIMSDLFSIYLKEQAAKIEIVKKINGNSGVV